MPCAVGGHRSDRTGHDRRRRRVALDAEWVADQARCVLEDMPVTVFKIGVLGSVEIIAAIAEVVSDYPEVPLVLDPVLSSGRGDELATDDMVTAMRELLVPQTTIITPNSLEARRLALDESDDSDDPSSRRMRRRILTLGCEYVLITGTHENTPQVVNTLYSQDGVVRIGQLAALAGYLSRLGLHACLRDRCNDRQRAADQRRGARCAGIHLADAQRGLSAGHGPAYSRPPVLGAGDDETSTKKRMVSGLVRGNALIPLDTAGCVRASSAALGGGARTVQYRNKTGDRSQRREQA